MKKIDMTNVQEAGERARIPAGAYICKITAAKDYPDKEYLKVFYDIADGEYANYYTQLRADHPDWESVGAYYKSYKTTALPMFKRFCSAISKSNGNFVFDGGNVNADESTLSDKLIGLVFREEEYYSNSGDLKTRLIVHSEFPIDKLDDQKIPDVKRINKPVSTTNAPIDTNDFMNVTDAVADEVPWS